jgi:hypothetical protein
MPRRSLTFIVLLYSLIYLGISSVIRVDDELFGRYMAGIYICIAITAAQFADTVIFYICRMKEIKTIRLVSLLAALIFLINVDMFGAFNKYNMKSREIIIQLQQRSSMSLGERDLEMAGSPLFTLRQYPILEQWANPTAFGVRIQYMGDGDPEPADATCDSVRSTR